MGHLFLEVISWILFVRTIVSYNLKIDYDPTLPIADQKQKETQTKTYVQWEDQSFIFH